MRCSDDVWFVLISIYFPNGYSSSERLQYKMEFYDHFLEFVEKIKASGTGIVICGDCNTAHTEKDMARPKPNEGSSGFLPIEREWMDRFISHGYRDTFRMFNQGTGKLHPLGPDNPGPGPERRMAPRLHLCGRHFCCPGDRRLHPR